MFTEVAFIFESNIVRNNISSSIKHILSDISMKTENWKLHSVFCKIM